MTAWQERLTPDQMDWDYLEEKHFRAAEVAGNKLGARNADLMCDSDDYYQDCLIWMASHRARVETVTHMSQLARMLVERVLRTVQEEESLAKSISRDKDVGELT